MSLKKYLQQFSKEQLIQQIIELNKKYKDVSTYYRFALNPDNRARLDEFKVKLFACFYPKRGYKLDLKGARKLVNDFKKLSPGEEVLTDLMLYYVECGVKFTNDFGDISEPFYTSVESMFGDTCKLIGANNLKPVFDERCLQILDNSSDTGWGFPDMLNQHYFEWLG